MEGLGQGDMVQLLREWVSELNLGDPDLERQRQEDFWAFVHRALCLNWEAPSSMTDWVKN